MAELSTPTIETVLGPVPIAELGIVSPHEHVFIDMEVFFSEPVDTERREVAHAPVTIERLGLLKRNCFALLDNVKMLDEEVQNEEVGHFRAAGGTAIVDATTHGLGRDAVRLARTSRATGVAIVAGAGFYVAPAQDHRTLDLTIEEIESTIVHELEDGFDGTHIRAGIIGEVGISHEMHPFEERSLRGACQAQLATGAPLLIHINPWSTEGRAALPILREYRIEPERTVICHADVENREDYILELLDSGCFVEFDNFGKEMTADPTDIRPGNGSFVSDNDRVRLVARLVERRYAAQLLFSNDVCLKTLLHRYGGWGYDHVLTNIVPMLAAAGVSAADLDLILKENPKRWLAG